MKADGMNQVRLTDNPAVDTTPYWGPSENEKAKVKADFCLLSLYS